MTPASGEPAYRALHASGLLARRAQEAVRHLAPCRLCPRRCGVNRLAGEQGFCRTGRQAVLSSAVPHMGEEPPISGRRGSGTVFFTHCNMACTFCQNHEISQGGRGEEVSARELARVMCELQARGCHNINVVTPSHVAPQILEALAAAADDGLAIPVVWNSGGFDGIETLALLSGVVDIFMPDLKYGSDEAAVRLSRAPGYVAHARAALREMYRQAGDLVLDEHGVAVRGLLVRHLVLPADLSGTGECLRFLARELSTKIGLSLMSQYGPRHRACADPDLGRGLRRDEYLRACRLAEQLGFDDAWIQHMTSSDQWLPDFDGDDPFQQWR